MQQASLLLLQLQWTVLPRVEFVATKRRTLTMREAKSPPRSSSPPHHLLLLALLLFLTIQSAVTSSSQDGEKDGTRRAPEEKHMEASLVLHEASAEDLEEVKRSVKTHHRERSESIAEDDEEERLDVGGGGDGVGGGFKSRLPLTGSEAALELPRAAALQGIPISLQQQAQKQQKDVVVGGSSSAGPQSLHGLPFGGGIPSSCAMCSRERNLCRIISGIFTRATLPYGYSRITPIPAGVCNITITEMKASKNFFALRRPDGTYLLNGNWDIEAAGDYPIGGTVFSYTPSQGDQGERLSAPGPLQKPVDLVLIAQSPNPGIKYEFRVPLPELLGVQPGAHSPNFALPGQGSSSFRPPPPPSAPASGAAGVGLTGTGVGVHTPSSPLGTPGQSRPVGSGFIPQNPAVRPDPSFSNTGFNFGSRNPSITGAVPVGGIPSGSIRPGSINPRQGVPPLLPNNPSRGALNPGRGTLSPSPGQPDPLLPWGNIRPPGRTSGGQQKTPQETGRGVYSLYPITPNVQSGLETPHQQPRLPNLSVPRQGIQGNIFVPPGASGFGLSGRDRGGGGVLFPGATSGGTTGLREPVRDNSSSSYGSRPQVPPEYPPNSVPLRPIPIPGHREDKNLLPVNSRLPGVGSGSGVGDTDGQRLARRPEDRLRPIATTASPVPESTQHRIRHGHHKQPIRPGRPFTTTKRPRTSQQHPKRQRTRNQSTSGSPRKTGGSLYGHGVQQTEPQRTRPPRRRGERKGKRERKRHPGGRGTSSGGQTRSGRRYEWVLKGFTECSRPCGGGNRTNVVSCQHRRKGRVVADRRCAKLPFPNTTVVSCNLKPCPAEWMPGEWGPCSVTCGMGVQTRPLHCKQVVSPKLIMMVPEGACLSPPTVAGSQVCKLRACASEYPTWEVGPWGSCMAPCGVGTRRRNVTCNEKGVQVAKEECAGEDPPEEEELCHMGSCAINTWFFSDWSEQCSETCGTGVQTRRLYCSGGPEPGQEGQCPAAHRPEASRPCRAEKGCGGQWFTGPWGPCSSHCSGGEETRSVLCVVWGRGQWRITLDTDCHSEERPLEARPCNLEPCRPEWYSSEWSQCSVTCGAGIMRREIKCLDEHQHPSSDCGNSTQPASQQRCLLEPCFLSREEEKEEEKMGEEEEAEEEEVEMEAGPETESPEHTTTSAGELLEEEEEMEEEEEEEVDGLLTGVTSPSSSRNAIESSFGTTSRTSEVFGSETSKDFDELQMKDSRKEDKVEEEEEEEGEEEEETVNSEAVANSHDYDGVTPQGTVTEDKETTSLYDDEDDEVANELIVEEPKGDDLNIIPDKDAQGDESVADDDGEEEEVEEEEKQEEKEHQEEERKRRKKNKKRKKTHHSRESQDSSRKSSHSRPGSCIDRIKNCHLVFRARLCRIKYYNKECCRTCHAR